MKKILFIILVIIFNLSLNAQQNFYYYQGEKIFLQQRTDKMFLKFAFGIQKERILALIDSDSSLQPTSDINLDELDLYQNSIKYVVLEAKEGNQISSATIEFYKAMEEIISATFLFQYNETLQGLMDEFVIKLRETTSYAQLQELAEKNFCTIGEENPFVKNQFMLHVAKTSNIDALQMSNLFYETGLFEWTSPSFFSCGGSIILH